MTLKLIWTVLRIWTGIAPQAASVEDQVIVVVEGASIEDARESEVQVTRQDPNQKEEMENIA